MTATKTEEEKMSNQPKKNLEPETVEKDVVIIGAGYGGLLCGAMLARQGLKVLIIDISDIIGQPGGSYPYNGYCLDWGNRDAVGMRDPFLVTSKYDLIAAERAGAKLNLSQMHEVMLVHVAHEGKVVPAGYDSQEKITPFLRDVFGIPEDHHHYFIELLDSMGKESPQPRLLGKAERDRPRLA